MMMSGIMGMARHEGLVRGEGSWEAYRVLEALGAFRRARIQSLVRRAAAVVGLGPWRRLPREVPVGSERRTTPRAQDIPIGAVVGLWAGNRGPVPLPPLGRAVCDAWVRAYLAPATAGRAPFAVRRVGDVYLLARTDSSVWCLEVLRALGVSRLKAMVLTPVEDGPRVLKRPAEEAPSRVAPQDAQDKLCACARGTGAG